jgi:hypothetical protein
MTVVIVEQHLELALDLVDYACGGDRGRNLSGARGRCANTPGVPRAFSALRKACPAFLADNSPLVCRPVGNTARRSIVGSDQSPGMDLTAPDFNSGANIHSEATARPRLVNMPLHPRRRA